MYLEIGCTTKLANDEMFNVNGTSSICHVACLCGDNYGTNSEVLFLDCSCTKVF